MKRITIAFILLLIVCTSIFVWRLQKADAVDSMIDQRQMLPPKPAPLNENVKIITVDRCSQTFATGDSLMFKYFDSLTNATYLDMAGDAFSALPVSVDRELRLGLVKLAKLDGNGCLTHLNVVHQLQPTNERATLYKGYCLEILGDINGAKNAFLEVIWIFFIYFD